jgi:hypothetical protein
MKTNGNLTPEIDGLQANIIFCLWTGEELMSENRLKALWSIFKNTGRPVVFLTHTTLRDWVLEDYPLHEAYEYLSSTHKADYLRCYLMHHYGGGYTDIKHTEKAWASFFSKLAFSEEHIALGYPEIAEGIPHIEGEFGDLLREHHTELIGMCSFIFKKGTMLTSEWLSATDKLLSEKLHLLKSNPGKHALDQLGILLPDGEISRYPLKWAELLGEILHPLLFKYRHSIMKESINPKFSGYR